MSDRNSGKTSEQKPGNPNIVTGAMIVGAGMIAVIGTLMPDLAGLTGPEATWIPIIFYAVAAVEVAMAFFLRSRILKARGGPAAKARSGGTIQRQ